jgi:addiction module HigA family antidote
VTEPIIIYPGEILQEEFLEPMEISQNELAAKTQIPASCISEIIQGKSSITADIALKLGKFFGTSAEIWMGLKKEYDLRKKMVEGASQFISLMEFLRTVQILIKDG